MASNVPYVTFHNGHKMPMLGLGTWQSPPDDVKMAVNHALETGYRHIDTAFLYRNEAAIGQVLAEWIQSGRIKREELFIVTKLPMTANQPEKVRHFLSASLMSLKLDYVDLYLIHFPTGIKDVGEGSGSIAWNDNGEVHLDLETDLVALWRAMEVQVDEGRARSIGISNFNSQQIERVVKASRIKPANLQVEMHAYFQQKPLRALCARHGITVCAFAPLGSGGRLSGRSAQPVAGLFENDVVKKIAESHSKTAAQVLLRHLVQLNAVVIPKSVTQERIVENFKVFDFVLSQEDMNALDALDRGQEHRSFTMTYFGGISAHPEFPFNIPF